MKKPRQSSLLSFIAPKPIADNECVPAPSKNYEKIVPSTPEQKDVVLVPETALRERPSTPPISSTRPQLAIPDSAVPRKVPEKITAVLKIKDEPIDSPPKPLPKLNETPVVPVKRQREEETTDLPFAKRGYGLLLFA